MRLCAPLHYNDEISKLRNFRNVLSEIIIFLVLATEKKDFRIFISKSKTKSKPKTNENKQTNNRFTAPSGHAESRQTTLKFEL